MVSKRMTTMTITEAELVDMWDRSKLWTTDAQRLIAEVRRLRKVIQQAVTVLETCEIMQESIMHDDLKGAL